MQIEIVTYDFENVKALTIQEGDNELHMNDSISYEVYSLLKKHTMSPIFIKMPKENQLSEFKYSITFWVDNDLWFVLLSDDLNVIYKNEDWYVITNGLEFKNEIEKILALTSHEP